MTKQEFIFSDNTSHRFIRHLVFWLIYGVFFYLQSVTPEVITVLYHSNAFYFAWVSVYCYLPACICSVYIFLYFLLPHYLQKKKYWQFIVAVFTLYAIFSFINYYMALLFFKNTCNCDVTKLNRREVFGYGNNNAFLAIVVGCFAAGIKFTKHRFIQRRQILELASQKAKAELQILKTSIQPAFLFHSLNSIYTNIKSGSDASPAMILNFSEILSYTLYDCDTDFVPLQKELSVINAFLLLEQEKMKAAFTIKIKHKGEAENKLIVPSLLLSYLQNCFTKLYDDKLSGFIIKVESCIEDNELQFLFSAQPPDGETKAYPINWNEPLKKIQDILSKFYKDNHNLELKQDRYQTIISLKLTLGTVQTEAPLEDEQINTSIYETV